jgi:hypothetical protein
MYIDKPLQQHTLVQTISRVNRVYPGKDKGLVVDYIGIKNNMNTALKRYATGDTDADSVETIDQSIAMVKDELDYWYADACRRYMKKVIRTDTIIILIVSFLVLQFIPLIGAIGFFAGFFLKWLFNKGAAGPNDQNIAETIAIFVRFAKTGKEEDFKEILIQAAWKLKNESLYRHI